MKYEKQIMLTSEEPRAIWEARQEEARSLVLRKLTLRVSTISELQRQIQVLLLEQVEALAKALLDFAAIAKGTGNSKRQKNLSELYWFIRNLCVPPRQTWRYFALKNSILTIRYKFT